MRHIRIVAIVLVVMLMSAMACFAADSNLNLEGNLTWYFYTYLSWQNDYSWHDHVMQRTGTGYSQVLASIRSADTLSSLTEYAYVTIYVKCYDDDIPHYNITFPFYSDKVYKTTKYIDGQTVTQSSLGLNVQQNNVSDNVKWFAFTYPKQVLLDAGLYSFNASSSANYTKSLAYVYMVNRNEHYKFDFKDMLIKAGEPENNPFEDEVSEFSYSIPANTPINIPAGYALVAKLGSTDASSNVYLQSLTTRSTSFLYRDNRSYGILDTYEPYQFTLSNYSTQNGFMSAVPWNISGSPLRVSKGEYVDAEISLAGKTGKYLYIYNPYLDYNSSTGNSKGQSIMAVFNCQTEFVKLIQNTNSATGGNDTVSFTEDSTTFQYAALFDENGNMTNSGWVFGENADNTQTTTPQGFTSPEYYNPIDGYDGESLNINLYNPAEVATEVKDGITNVFTAISEIFTGLPVEITRLLLAFLGILLTIGVIKAIL